MVERMAIAIGGTSAPAHRISTFGVLGSMPMSARISSMRPDLCERRVRRFARFLGRLVADRLFEAKYE